MVGEQTDRWHQSHSVVAAAPDFFFFFLPVNEVKLIYSVVLTSVGQQSDSVIYIHTFFFILISITIYPWLLNIILCAV